MLILMLPMLMLVVVAHASVVANVVATSDIAPMNARMLTDDRVGVGDYADVVDAPNEVMRTTKS